MIHVGIIECFKGHCQSSESVLHSIRKLEGAFYHLPIEQPIIGSLQVFGDLGSSC
jgi:hypothetical protein